MLRARRTPHLLKKLLVIDEDAKLLSSYRDLLTPHGFEVLTAENAEKGRDLVERNGDILLVIVDPVMADSKGEEWLQWFRRGHNQVPVIVVSSHAYDSSDTLQPSAILAKPFHVAELLDLVGLFSGLGYKEAPGA